MNDEEWGSDNVFDGSAIVKQTNSPTAKETNLEYYESSAAGREDYWRKMAAPRLRARTFLGLMRETPPGNLIDLGCGNGLLLEEVGRHFSQAKLAGIDLSTALIQASHRTKRNVEWFACDLQQSDSINPELHGRFDTVVASELIEHLEEPSVMLVNAFKLASPGGRLLLSTQSGPIRETERRVGHHRHFSQSEMSTLLTQAGWEPMRIWNTGFPFHGLSKWWANIDPDKSMAQFSGRAYGPYQNFICVALRFAFLLNSRSRGAQLFVVARKPSRV